MEWFFQTIKGTRYNSALRSCNTAGRPSQYAKNPRAYLLDFRLLVRVEVQARHIQMTERKPPGSSVPKHVYAVDALRKHLTKKLPKGKALRAHADASTGLSGPPMGSACSTANTYT